MATNRLNRETNPPSGSKASPTPQYADETSGEYTAIEGSDGSMNVRDPLQSYGNGAPGAHAGELVGAMYLDITNGDIYASTGAAWVLKLEGIWD